MRPRALIDLLNHCRSHSVNLGHERSEVDDILQGESSYSSDLVSNMGVEIRDVLPAATDILYAFVGHGPHISRDELRKEFEQFGVRGREEDQLEDLLLWYGVLGFVREDGEASYIYSVNYDAKRLRALIGKKPVEQVVYQINPAFWRFLDITAE